jgi:hypothetical protein
MKMTKEKFRQTDDCQFCGSQRCDASDEMMDYCARWIDLNSQGLCKTCFWTLVCDDARKFLEITSCNKYIESRKHNETTNNRS